MSVSITTLYVMINLFVVMILASIPFIFFSVYADSTTMWKITIVEGSSERNQSPWFYPDELPFREGDTIIWENKDSIVHRIISGVPENLEHAGIFFKPGEIRPGESVSTTLVKGDFNAYYYFCEIHPWMKGKIFFSDEPIAQSEAENPIKTEKAVYQFGEVINIMGQVHEDFAKTNYKILIYDQENNLVDFSSDNFNEDATYNHVLNVYDDNWKYNGKYLVRLVYGLPSKVAQTSFEFEDASKELSDVAYIPSWIKKIGDYWCDSKIDDLEFIYAIEYLVREEIILIESQSNSFTSSSIPSWIKNNACWWSNNQLSDSAFLSGIEFLVNIGTIRI